jgi:Protein of unknown function DUF262
MAYQPPVPVTEVLTSIHNRSYVLPAIQREFEWSTDQIRRLFDSLIRGYPIGSFLFWQVSPAVVARFRFYDFLTDYHERNHPYAPQVAIPAGQGVTAILDGQQRLTALNIGLYGSHAERQARKWASNPDAYLTKHLYLDITGQYAGEEELGMEYGFRFLTDSEAQSPLGEANRWYKVADILHLADSGPAMNREIQRRGLGEHSDAFQTLYELFKAVRETPSINFYLEKNEDPDKVLDIFVRVNSAGTQLSYSDLLMSMATNQWTMLDARQEIRSLVDDLNGEHFQFTKDLVLKAGLVLTDVPDVRFKVTNFTRQNTALMEKRWSELRSALLTAGSLLRSFGFAAQTLAANSVLIPIAYYIHFRALGESYVTSSSDAADRELVRAWITRSLMKRGIWGSGLDTLLSRLRDVLRDSPGGFPADQLETVMTAQGKSLRFEGAEIDELLESRYGRPRTFATLAMLYPGIDLTQAFHVDHIFPRSLFTRSKLTKAGIPTEQREAYFNAVDSLPNLQLLPGIPNIEKQATLPSDWLLGPHFPTAEKRERYLEQNDLQGLPLELERFLAFHAARRELMASRLRDIVGTKALPTQT